MNHTLRDKKVKLYFMAKPKPTRNMAFSERLRLVYARKFSTQTLFAQALGVSFSDVSGYLHKGIVPEWTRLTKMREVLGVTIDYLLVGPEQDLSEELQEVVQFGKSLSPDLQKSLAQCTRVMNSGEDDLIEQLVKLGATLEELIIKGRPKKPAAPRHPEPLN